MNMNTIITEEITNTIIREVFEAMTGLIIYKMLTSKEPFDIGLILKTSLMIGLITTVLEKYNPSYSKSVKSGALVTIGGSLIKNS